MRPVVGVFRQTGHGVVDIVDTTQVTNFTQTGGTLVGTGDLIVSGDLNWLGGTLLGSGTLISDGTLTITGSSGKFLQRRLENRGTAKQDNGFSFRSDGPSSATLINAVGATYELVGDSSIGRWDGSGHRFENHGTLIHTGTGTSTINGGTLESTGTIIVSEGALRVHEGGSSAGNLQLTGGDFEVSGGTFSIAQPNTTGVGVFRQTDGLVDIVDTTQVTNFTQTGGTLVGSGDLIVSGDLNWLGGTLLGSGTLISDGTLTITGSSGKFLQRRLENRGTAKQDNGFSFRSDGPSSATLINAVGATYELVGDSSIGRWDGSGHRFENHGTLIHTGTGTSTINGGTLESTGTIIVSEGALRVHEGGSSAGNLQLTGGDFEVSGGTFSIAQPNTTGVGVFRQTDGLVDIVDTTQVTNFTQTGGTLVGSGDLIVSGDLNWLGGTLLGSGTLISDGTLTITGSSGKFLQRRLENRGTAKQDNGFSFRSDGPSSATLINAVGATYELVGDSSIGRWDGSGHRFENHGTLIHTGTGTSTINGGTLESTGTIIVSEGALRVHEGGSSAGNLQLTGGDFEVSGGTFSIAQPNTTGVGVFRQTDGLVDIVDTTQVTNFTQTGGTLVGSGDLIVSGDLNWLGGTLLGSGTLISDGTLTITGSSGKFLQRRLENRGTAKQDNGFSFRSDGPSSATLINAVGATYELVGDSSIGRWDGSGHRFENHGTLIHTGAGTSTIDGGTLESTGTVIVKQGELRVDGDVQIDNPQYLSIADTASFRITGSIVGSTQQEAAQQTGGTLIFNGNGSDVTPQLLEVQGRNLGPVADGFDSNFSYGGIEVLSTYVRLQDIEDNAFGDDAESLYVGRLYVSPGSTLDLNGLTAYVRQSEIAGTVIGNVVTIPDGGPLVINSSNLGAIEALSEQDNWTFYGRSGSAITLFLNPGNAAERDVLQPFLGGGKVTLLAPDGSMLTSADSSTQGETASLTGIELTHTGFYTVRVEANNASANGLGNYSLSVFDATIDERDFTFNERMIGQLENRFSIDRWVIEAQQNDQVQFDFIASQVNGLKFTFSGPSNWTGFVDATSDSKLITLPYTGQYTIVADSLGLGEGSYAFELQQTTVTDLVLGVPVVDSFASSGSAKLYRFEHDGTGPLVFAVAESNSASRTEMYLGFGSAPTRRSYDFLASDDGTIAAVGPAGTWFILLVGQDVAEASSYTLFSSNSTGLLTSVTPSAVAKLDDVLLSFKGVGFAPGTMATLIDSEGLEVTSSEITIDNLYRVTAVFDLSEVATGTYSARITFADGSTDVLEDSVEVKESLRPILTTALIMPDVVGRHMLATIYVEYANIGDGPLAAPILTVAPWQNPEPYEFFVFNTAHFVDFPGLLSEGWQLDEEWSDSSGCGSSGPQGGTCTPTYYRRLYRVDESLLDKPILTLDQSLLSTGYWTSNMPDGFSTSVQIYAQGQTPGLLMPGESVRVPVYYAGQLADAWDDELNLRLFIRAADSTDPVDFESYVTDFKPDGISEEAWTRVIEQLRSNVGTTWGDYISMLSENAQYLDRIGRPTNNVADLFGFEFLQANGLSATPVLASAVDASMPSPGLSLSYGRTFGNTITERSTLGPYGRGWQAPSLSRLELSEDGTINVYESEAYIRRFQPDLRLDGDFITALGDTGSIRRLVNGEYQLVEVSGLMRLFGSDGKLQFTEDRDGNRITYSYNGDQLLAMTHLSGASLTFAYNTHGFIESITDSTGWTKTFAYDPSTQQLLSTTSPAGTTRYTYGTLDSERYAITSVEDPTGVVRYFDYDNAGRLVASYLGDQVQRVQYDYDQPGRITITDETGVTGRIYLDDRGQLARSEDGSGNYQLFVYDAAGYLISSTDVTGTGQTSNWSSQGQYLGGRDGALNSFRFEPGGPFGQSLSFTDTKGNSISYRYNASGNLASRIYPDGTVESYTYDSLGNVTETTSRRGQTIQRSYNTLGQLTNVNSPDGRHIALSYDSVNRLATVNDSGQITQYTYDVADRVTRIDYPQGRWIAYEYDAAGRRTRLEDHSGHVVQYAYDNIGRLASLLNATGSLIVAYQYDLAGRIASETRGNGTRSVNTFDSNGRILSISNEQADGTVNSFFGYSYDILGRRTGMTTLDGSWSYNYDALDQLVRAEFISSNPGMNDELLIYEYDSAGNRTRTVRNGVESFYGTNNLNQITSVDSTNYQYDLGGNLIRKSGPDGTYTYAYDVNDRLVLVTGPEGVVQYEYDAFGNRVSEIKDGVREEYLVDPAGLGNVIGSYSHDGTRTETYTYGFGLESLYANGQELYYDFDALGSTAGLSSAVGHYVNQYAYTPFGIKLNEAESIDNNFEYVGQLGVAHSVGDLSYMRARFYSAADGRFLSADPIGLQSGDYNIYRYVYNSPVSLTDESGLSIGGGFAAGLRQRRCGTGNENAAPILAEIMEGLGGGLPGCRPPPGPKGGPPPGGDGGAPGGSGNAESIDPNEKLAIGGYGDQGFIAPGKTIPYRVRFENLGPGSDPVPARPASAPAQRVVITDQLSTDLDWTTLRFTEYGFGEYFITLAQPAPYYFATLPVVIDGKSFDVEVELSFNPSTGLIRTVFQSIDPAIGLPPDVLTGFLPPEDGTEIGQGFIEFTIEHVADIADGTVIRNIAEIRFDGQTIIATNQIDPQDPSQGTDPLLEAPVTIDASPPTSFITLVQPNESGDQLTIQWSGDDGQGSGIASYTLFVAINGSEPVVLIPNTDQVETTLPIDPSKTYQFFVSAIDHVGNRNALPTGFLGDSIAATHDFGDAPFPYPVELMLDGARHLATGPRLGTYRDAEFSGQGNPEALGDDWFGDFNDEDGVFIPNLTAGGQSVVISVDVQEAPGGAFLNAWIDFDQDGIWNDQNERIAHDLMVVNGVNQIVFNVPSSAGSGVTFARFRLSTQAGLGTTGSAPDGEVEDYMLTIENQPPVLTRSAAQVSGNVLAELLNNGTWSDPESGLVSLSTSLGTVTKNSDGTWNWSYVASTRLENEVVTITADDGANQSLVTFEISTEVNVVDRKVYYKGSNFDAGGSDIAAALDSSKILAVEGVAPQTLSYDNLINSARGITGIVLDVAGLVGTNLTSADISAKMSPQGAFDESANPPSGWEPAPQPIIFVISGTSTTPARIRLEWPDNAITNRWLTIEVAATPNTGLIEPERFYLGHLLGETTGPNNGIYTVSFADITPIRAAVGQTVDATSIADIDKSGTVAFADISAMRANVGAQLTNITIPATSAGNGEMAMFSSPGQGSDVKDPQRGGQPMAERFSALRAAPRIESDASWVIAVGTEKRTEHLSKLDRHEQPPLIPHDRDQAAREALWIHVTDQFFGSMESEMESLPLLLELETISDESESLWD
jgi:RHS repeat-associated protein